MTSETCARQRRASLGFWTWNQTQGLSVPLRRLTAVLTLPERRCPGEDSNLGPCGHGALALLDEPLSHVRKLLFGTSIVHSGARILRASLGYLFAALCASG